MAKIFDFTVDTPTGLRAFALEAGASLLFVGANGSGKTRLAGKIETGLSEKAHRISAHRALTLNPDVPKISEDIARKGLKYGYANRESGLHYRENQRWGGNKFYTHLLNDFDLLIQTLFADQSNKSLITHKKVRAGDRSDASPTLFEKLEAIWESLITHRNLVITGDGIEVITKGSTLRYSASEMSDGERAIFYLIGQTLCADEDSVLIFDEPELHIHRAIMSKLWDQLEASRPDCCFIFISHDLEFVASRIGQKFVIRDYDPAGKWTFEEVPNDTGFSEEMTTLILGSRQPVLFVEGSESSLDYAVYRNRYPKWTVIVKGSCEEVIHSVVTLRNNEKLTRVSCSGIVDADDRTEEQVRRLNDLGIATLPVSEIENLFLLPPVTDAICSHEGFGDVDKMERIAKLTEAVFKHVAHGSNIEDAVLRYCQRSVNDALTRVDLSPAKTASELAIVYEIETAKIDVEALMNKRRDEINACVARKDLVSLLSIYDNKGLLALAASNLRSTRNDEFKNWIVRMLGGDKAPEFSSAVFGLFPNLQQGSNINSTP